MGSFNTFLNAGGLRTGGGGLILGGAVALNMYTLTSNAFGAGAFTLPSSGTSFSVLAFGAGGSGASGAIAQFSFNIGSAGGGSGAGGGRAFCDFANSASSALNFTTVVPGATPVTGNGPYNNVGSGAAVATGITGSTGGSATVSVGAIQIIGATGGEGGQGGTCVIPNGGGTPSFSGGGGGAIVGVGQAITDDTQPISGTTLTPSNAVNSGDDQAVADNAKVGTQGGTQSGFSSLANTTTVGAGARPGAGHDGAFGGGTTITGQTFGNSGGSGGAGEMTITIIAGEGLSIGAFNLTGFSFVDNGPFTP